MTLILPQQDDPIIIQGITGRYGSLHARLMLEYGTNVAAGVTPGKGGTRIQGIPVCETMSDAVALTGAKTSILFVPAPSLLSAAEEAVDAGMRFIVVITEHVPIRDTLRMIRLGEENNVKFVGPNTPGVILPSRKTKLGIMPATAFSEGKVALFSRSGTLMYEVANTLSLAGLGQRIALGIGGDPLNCTTLSECFDWAALETGANCIVLVGEIGGDAEEILAQHMVDAKFTKPVVAYIAGRSAPREKHMGHAGAIIYGEKGTAESKISALRDAGALVAITTAEIPSLVKALPV
jgi:succinyl-CoA synthetase alpha subunit